MKTPNFRQIDFAIPAHWSPEEALAVFELLDDLRDKIWDHYGLPLQQLLAEQQQTAPPHPTLPRRNLPNPTNSQMKSLSNLPQTAHAGSDRLQGALGSLWPMDRTSGKSAFTPPPRRRRAVVVPVQTS
jgi:hypothetical protein